MKDDPAPVGAAPAAAASASEAKTTSPSAAPVTGAVETPTTPAASTNVPLDPLLDLVPAGATTFFVVRAPYDFIDGFAGIVLGQESLWTKLLDARKDPANPGADAGMRKLLVEFATVKTAISTSGVHLERGVAVGGDPAIFVFAADDVEAVPKLQRALTTKPEDVKTTCKAVPDVAGFVACSEDAAAVAAYAPGKSAAALRTTLTGLAIEDANVVGAASPSGATTTFAVATPAGVLQIDVRPSKGVEELAKVAAPGAATALALVKPGNSFSWGRVDAEFLATQAATAPAMLGNALRGLTGEFLVASIGATPGLVVLAGLSDPTPLAGLVPMAALAKDSIPKTLPDGTPMSLVVEEVDDGAGGKLQAVRTKFEPKGELEQMRAQLGIQAEVTAFVTKQWAAVAVGTGPAVVPDVVKATASAPTPELLAALPPALAKDLGDASVSGATHLELDAMHAPKVREELAKALAAADTPAELTKDEWLDLGYAVFSPLSSISVWAAGDRAQPTIRIALRGFGDTATDEGRAAQAARIEVAAKRADAATAYGALATGHPSSPRVSAYLARAGQGDPGGGAVAVVGVLAAIAIPAFQKYIQRSKEAAAGLPSK